MYVCSFLILTTDDYRKEYVLMKTIRKGFTLVELLIVIVVIGILSAMMMLSSTEAVTSCELPKSKDLGFLLHWRILAQNTLRYLYSGISLHKTLRSLFRRDVSFI